ncbi:MAG: aminopeptidase [Saprospiraceae bacterium]|nr:aminopeptidase [Saprospiraceae bacterium]
MAIPDISFLRKEIKEINMIGKYAQLLVEYCLELKEGERLFIQSTTLAEPLVREVYRHALRIGAHVVTDLEWREQHRIYFQESKEHQLQWLSPNQEKIFADFEAYLYIRAPFNLREDQNIDPDKIKIRSEARKEVSEVYSKRTATRALKRCLCQYPTQASAQQAGMSLEEYESFVFNACKLYDEDPKASWLQVRREQQYIVDYLNKIAEITFKKEGTNLTCNVKDRIWMNSDGQTNMPSGEVYTAPHEEQVNGTVYFDYPSIFRGHPVEGILLEIKDGKVVDYSAKTGQKLLDEVFAVKGARTFGEVAIGTNYSIQQPTGNILFDEKIGGSFHMAVGQAYYQTGGKNTSTIHWDMISDMKKDGEIWADGKLIYRQGKFLI